MSYKLRVDLLYSTTDKVVGVLKRFCQVYVYVVEGSYDSTHMHVWFLYDGDAQAIRKQLKAVVTGKGNAVYSLKQCHAEDDDVSIGGVTYPIAYIAYMCKDGDPVFVHIPDEVIDLSHDYQKAVVERMRERRQKRSVLDILDQTFADKVTCHGGHYVLKSPGFLTGCHSLQQSDIVKHVLDYVKENRLLYRHFMVVNWCQTLCLKYMADDGYYETLKDRLLSCL